MRSAFHPCPSTKTGSAKRAGKIAIKKLPIRLLRVAKPQGIALQGLVVREQALHDFGAHRELNAGFAGLRAAQACLGLASLEFISFWPLALVGIA